MGKLLLLFLTLSFGSPNIAPNPTDYEINIGVEAEDITCEALFERENGAFFRGLDCLAWQDLGKEWQVTERIYVKEAKLINSQKLKVGKKVSFLNVGLAMNTREWSDPAYLLDVSWDVPGFFNIYKATDFSGREQLGIRVGRKIPVGSGGVFVEPFYRFERLSGVEVWQAKVAVGIDFKVLDSQR